MIKYLNLNLNKSRFENDYDFLLKTFLLRIKNIFFFKSALSNSDLNDQSCEKLITRHNKVNN